MRESIKRVEATRPARLQETWPMMSPAEKQEILRKFHPDYKPEGMRELRVGPAKGMRTPHELADLLEGHSLLRGVELDLEQVDYDTDVLIIGGGGAGSAAALLAREEGAKVLMVTKLRHGDANTMMAQGGIQAADKANDSPVIHYLDVIGGGHFHQRSRPGRGAGARRAGGHRLAGEPGLHVRQGAGRHDGHASTAAAPAASGCTRPATIPGPRSCAPCATRSAPTPRTSPSSSSPRPSS